MQIDYSKRIFGLDIMRAGAILMVVVSHALWLVPNAKGLIPELLKLAGVMGVEVFFVLSGYLIGRIVLRVFTDKKFNYNRLKYFWVRRWFRTLPNYYLVLILNILLMLYFGNELPKNLWLYFVFLQNFAWEMPLFFNESWSLPIEEFAYVIGPLLLYSTLTFNLKISKTRVFLWVTLLVITFFTLTKIIYNYMVETEGMQFWNLNLKAVAIYRVDAIYFGVLAAYLSCRYPKLWKVRKTFSFALGFFVFILLNYAIQHYNLTIEHHPFFWNVLYLPINSIAIALSLPLLSNIQTARKWFLIPITFISVISYSMYLLHYSIVLRIVKNFVPYRELVPLEVLTYTSIYVAATIGFAYLLYRVFEKPFMDLRDKPFVINRFK